MCGRHNRTLSTLERTSYIQAARIVMTVDKPLDFRDLHGVLMLGDLTAGMYRINNVIDMLHLVQKPFPLPDKIEKLVSEMNCAYRDMLQCKEARDPVELQLELWCVAARLRCIRPFDRGTTRLSNLLLGQMRLAQGFPFLSEEFSLETFYLFRQRYQVEHQECYPKMKSAA